MVAQNVVMLSTWMLPTLLSTLYLYVQHHLLLLPYEQLAVRASRVSDRRRPAEELAETDASISTNTTDMLVIVKTGQVLMMSSR